MSLNNPMEKFEFLIGDWDLESKVPKSSFGEADTGTGTGTFKRALDGKYVFFDYHAEYTSGSGGAHGVFVWDEKTQVYRYWWFESSGAFMQATCHFTDDNTLYMSWHNSLLRQTFEKKSDNKVVLKMDHPKSDNEYELVLEVILRRK